MTLTKILDFSNTVMVPPNPAEPLRKSGYDGGSSVG